MAWSADDDYRTRVMSRRGAVLKLRDPEIVYAPAALVLLYAVGLIAAQWTATGFSSPGGAEALALSAGAAAAMTALDVGARLRRHCERGSGAVAVRVALIWAVVGAAWPLFGVLADLIARGPGHHSVADLVALSGALGQRALAGAAVGAIGGIAGAAAAIVLCVERRV